MHYSVHFILIFAFSFAGIFSTFHLNHTLKQGSVRSSALSSLVVGLIFYFTPNLFEPALQSSLPLCLMGASFIGMSNTRHFKSLSHMFMAAILFSFLYFLSIKIFTGYGGKLGLMANISVVISIAIFALFKYIFNSQKTFENKRLT